MSYAITIRKTQCPKKNTEEHYYAFLNQGLHSQTKFKPETVVKFESTAGLHAHLLVEFHGKQPRNKFHVYQLCKPKKGWNIKVDEITDADGWYNYITKDERISPDKAEHEHHKEWNQSVQRLTHKYGSLFKYFDHKRTKQCHLLMKV